MFAVAGAVFAVPQAGAEIVTHAQAMRLAQQFFNEAAGEIVTPPVEMVYKGKNLTTNKLFTPFYTFNSPRGGFVIISADNKTFPILAYSLTSGFDENRLTPGERRLLRNYARDVELIRYDSRVPEEAIAAWSHFPQYVHGLLHSPGEIYSSTPGVPDDAEAREIIGRIMATDDSDDLYSSLYSPDQWETMTDDQLGRDRYVLMGVVESEDTAWPMTVSGKRSGMYRISFGEGKEPWMARLNATEYLSGGLLADFRYVPESEEPVIEEHPFEFYESTVAEFAAAREAERRALEESLMPTEPVLKALGGGRFSIDMPGEITLVRIFNVGGAMIGQQTYGGTHTAWIDLGHEPGGFYLAQVFSEGSDPVTMKLYR